MHTYIFGHLFKQKIFVECWCKLEFYLTMSIKQATSENIISYVHGDLNFYLTPKRATTNYLLDLNILAWETGHNTKCSLCPAL